MTTTSTCRLFACSSLVLLVATAGCQKPAPPPAPVPVPAHEAYTPGLGELMSFQQMRHTKLWLAGDARNWKLAAYEVTELKEGFDDVVALHPTWKDSPVAPKDAIPIMVNDPIEQVRAAIDRKDSKAFVESYDTLTRACNACHQATNFGFNVVARPKTNPYPNQVFTPEK
jgi:hypothetical protein